MNTKIATLGTCTSENWYHFQKVRERLDAEILPFQPSSIISLMAKPVNLIVDPGAMLDKLEANRLRVDFDKSFLSQLVDYRPGVLIVELLADSRKGIIQVGDSFVTNSHRIEQSPMQERLGFAEPLTACSNPEEYMRLFEHSLSQLAGFLRQEIPECQIILHRARWAEYFVDENNQLQSYPPWKQNSYFVSNRRLDVMDDLFCQKIECDEIEVNDVPNFADNRHIWGPAADHYIKAYYGSFTDKLRALLASRPKKTIKRHEVIS